MKERLRRRIGIYGGTFDPVHIGHLKVAEAISSAFKLESILFVPAFTPPHKRKRMIGSPFHRMSMLALATTDSPKLFISTVELDAPSRPYTIETLKRLQIELEPARLFFIMGADSFKDVTSWREHEALLSGYDIIVATRPGYRGDADYEGLIKGKENAGSPTLAPQLKKLIIDLRGGLLPTMATNEFTKEDKEVKEDIEQEKIEEEKIEISESSRIYLTDYVSIDVSATGIREAVEQGRSIDDLVPPPVAAYIEKYRLYRK